jgi:hypothetical protein
MCRFLGVNEDLMEIAANLHKNAIIDQKNLPKSPENPDKNLTVQNRLRFQRVLSDFNIASISRYCKTDTT